MATMVDEKEMQGKKAGDLATVDKIAARREYNEAVLEAAMEGRKAPAPFEEWIVSKT